jgi:hypothetical protein
VTATWQPRAPLLGQATPQNSHPVSLLRPRLQQITTSDDGILPALDELAAMNIAMNVDDLWAGLLSVLDLDLPLLVQAVLLAPDVQVF